jgi:hypothetical protein
VRKDGGGEVGEKAALMKCTGCGEVEYCCKVSFILACLNMKGMEGVVANTLVRRSVKPRDGKRGDTKRTARSSRLFAPFGHDGSCYT